MRPDDMDNGENTVRLILVRWLCCIPPNLVRVAYAYWQYKQPENIRFVFILLKVLLIKSAIKQQASYHGRRVILRRPSNEASYC